MKLDNGTCERLLLHRCFYEVVGEDLDASYLGSELFHTIKHELVANKICPKYGILSTLESFNDVDKEHQDFQKELDIKKGQEMKVN